jgi:predicted RNase H-like nuclease (RuvC/YqgF family)
MEQKQTQTAEQFNLPWTYQEKSDAYTHIIRDKNDRYILQGRQLPDGSEESKMRFIVESVNATASLQQQVKELQDRNRKVEECLFDSRKFREKAEQQVKELKEQHREESVKLIRNLRADYQKDIQELKEENERLKAELFLQARQNDYKDELNYRKDARIAVLEEALREAQRIITMAATEAQRTETHRYLSGGYVEAIEAAAFQDSCGIYKALTSGKESNPKE